MRREDGQGRKKVVHRSHLLPINDPQERVFELGREESDDQIEMSLVQEPNASVVMRCTSLHILFLLVRYDR